MLDRVFQGLHYLLSEAQLSVVPGQQKADPQQADRVCPEQAASLLHVVGHRIQHQGRRCHEPPHKAPAREVVAPHEKKEREHEQDG